MVSRKVISREYLLGKEVITSDARRLGKVRDIGFVVDEEGRESACVIVDVGGGKVIDVPVSYIKAINDVVLLKEDVEIPSPVPASVASGSPSSPSVGRVSSTVSGGVESATTTRSLATRVGFEVPRCPKCGSALAYIPSKHEFYCYSCKEFVKVPGDVLAKVPRCPDCGLPLSYIEQYGKWYCYNCRKYVEVGS